MRWLAFLGSLAIAGLPAAGVAQSDVDPVQVVDGSYTYRSYCATCHGANAEGDGPLAGSLRSRPTDLTRLAAHNRGTFPTDRVVRIVDGRNPIRNHGGPDMPVWGDAFKNSRDGFDDEQVAEKIEAVVAYLKTLQVK